LLSRSSIGLRKHRPHPALEPKRRAAGYEIIDTRENTRRQVSIPLVDDIRQRVGQWREAGWPGVSPRSPWNC
jgi:hypothetical protein